MLDLASVNALASYATLALDLASLALIAVILFPQIVPVFKERFHARYGLWVAFAFTAAASFITLYYSEVLGQLPCSYCWLQRVFLYPQVVLLLIAAIINDRKVALYSIALSILGALIALYHHYLQMGGAQFLPCPANGNAVDCAVPTFISWGFVTFPFMSFSLFVFLILFMVRLRQIWRKYPQGEAW